MPRKTKKPVSYDQQPERIGVPTTGNPLDDLVLEDRELQPQIDTDETQIKKTIRVHPCSSVVTPLSPVFRDDGRGIFLYHGNCLAILDAIAAKQYGEPPPAPTSSCDL